MGEPYETLDWTNTQVVDGVLNLITEPLITYKKTDSGWQLTGALAESWKVDPSGLIWKVRLKKNIFWSDGAPLHASHIRDGFLRLLSPSSRSYFSSILFIIKNAKEYKSGQIDSEQVGIRALSQNELEFEITKPVVYFPHLLTLYQSGPVRKDIINKYSNREWLHPSKFVGLGPYLISEYKQDQYLKLIANPKYYKGRRSVNKITSLYISDESTALRMYKAKQVDFTMEVPGVGTSYESMKDLKLFTSSTIRALFFDLKYEEKINNDLRKAIYLALDRNQFEKINPFLKAQKFLVMPNWLDLKTSKDISSVRLAEARKLFKKSKFKGKLEIFFGPSENSRRVLENLQFQLKERLNLEVELKLMDSKQLYSQARNHLIPVYYMGFGPDYFDLHSILEFNQSQSTQNWIGWNNSEYDRLLLEAQIEKDSIVRKDKYLRAHNILLEKSYIIPLVSDKHKVLLNPKYKGILIPSIYRFDLRQLKKKE